MANKKINKMVKKILFLTFMYLFILISLLSPFIVIEGANKVLGYILAGIITLIYLFILLILFWDWFKTRVNK